MCVVYYLLENSIINVFHDIDTEGSYIGHKSYTIILFFSISAAVVHLCHYEAKEV